MIVEGERGEEEKEDVLVSSGILSGTLSDQRRRSISNLLESSLSTSLVSMLSTSILFVSDRVHMEGVIGKGQKREEVDDLPL